MPWFLDNSFELAMNGLYLLTLPFVMAAVGVKTIIDKIRRKK